jgi:hypothetical protein
VSCVSSLGSLAANLKKSGRLLTATMGKALSDAFRKRTIPFSQDKHPSSSTIPPGSIEARVFSSLDNNNTKNLVPAKFVAIPESCSICLANLSVAAQSDYDGRHDYPLNLDGPR